MVNAVSFHSFLSCASQTCVTCSNCYPPECIKSNFHNINKSLYCLFYTKVLNAACFTIRYVSDELVVFFDRCVTESTFEVFRMILLASSKRNATYTHTHTHTCGNIFVGRSAHYKIITGLLMVNWSTVSCVLVRLFSIKGYF